ncbi:thiol:disulfide interchange protein DsbD [Mucilaginibacter lappiensis]|uniref:Thiol:disulfide interchange protein DsbD n=1 Tax=Mucilaginibacter lappiensis TaxID=354630 RepID=A0ABR6PPZ7_9SPHI|nr:cytochrome c biogenesis protein CcdA [Mucilaginibacter lappiensis]MBB6111845.1 thiol:disulfide interchange protein DsbD [Mucilaginibacter lappiensis]SIR88531.1 thiol:disulfide interchange protein DsbD [Mucilaginibacter lappiensis]
MKLLKKGVYLRIVLATLMVLAIFCSVGVTPALAVQKTKADTVSTAGVQFTDIPTAADSIAIRKKAADSAAKAQASVKQKAEQQKAPSTEKPKTLWQIFIFGLLGGFTAVILPCIYPLLPLTVSFFTKKSGSRKKAIGQSLIYGVSIIIIYVTLGLLISIIFGSDALNQLATNGIFNIFFFLLLVVFGISFLGAFEITLPSSLANKLDANADKGGLAGIFFMASTLVVVSFSCTGPIIGTLLVDAASKGDRLGPAVGMFGFALALALPFTIFALFPSALKSLPKSGGWLNSVKVILGFLELAFALKFLSNVDLAYHWNWFDREIFLSLWIAIGLLMGLYLIGKVKFSHDSDVKYLSIPRTFLAIIVFAFVVYMIPGLWGAPLKSISAFLPPEATQDFNLSSIPGGLAAPSSTPTVVVPASIGEKKYAGNYTRIKTRGLDSWYDYDQALQVSKATHKPILIDFTGFNCVNCRKMEANVWSDPEVFRRLRDDFVLLQLVVDDKAALDTKEQFVSTYSGKKITTLGGKWSDLEASRFNSNSQPLYVMLDSEGSFLKDATGKDIPTSPADYDIASYIKFLDSGIAAFKK